MKAVNQLTALAFAIGLASVAQAATITVTANSKTYIDLDTGAILGTPADTEIMLDKGTVRAMIPAAYTGQQGANGYANVTSSNKPSSYNPLLGDSRLRVSNPALPLISRNANGDTLETWNKNWWGTAALNWGIGGDNIRALGGGQADSPFGNKFYEQKIQVVDTDKGLLYDRKLPNKEGDVVALDFNQLIVRTSKGNKFVRLRAVEIGDPAETTGPNSKTLRNWASNNVYFKYAIAGPDGQFGSEKDMCVSLSTDSRKTNPNGFAIQNPAVSSINNGIYKYTDKTFDYTLIDTDKWYKQQFIDFDTIIESGSDVKTVATSGEVDITPYAPALANGYAEPCLAAWNNARPSRYYPSLYQNGFKVTGADAPISSRRTDWMDNDNDPNNNSYNGNDEWDIALSFMAVPTTWGQIFSRSYQVRTQFRVNTGLIGNNAAGTTRTNPGFAAAVLVSGTPTDVRPDQDIGDAAGTYTLVNDIDTYTMPNGKTVRESLQANGKSVTELYTTFGTDANGNIVSNERVYALEFEDEYEGETYSWKFRVQSYNPQTNEYVIEYDAL